MTIVVIPPGLYVDFHMIAVSDMVNFFLDQNFLIIVCIELLTRGLLKCRLVVDRPKTSMLNFLMGSHTSSNVLKCEDFIPLTF